MFPIHIGRALRTNMMTQSQMCKWIDWRHVYHSITIGIIYIRYILSFWVHSGIVASNYTLRPRQIAAILQTIFSNAISWMKIYYFRFEMSLKVVPEGPIYNIPALIRKMAWRQSGDRPLSELMMVSLLMHVWITWPQWVNKIKWNTCDSPGCFMIFNRNKLLDWTHWGLGEVAVILRKQFQNFFCALL